jgi:cell division septation protein DedD
MNRDRIVYYVAFPLLVVALCAFSYYLGLSRGRQVASAPEVAKAVEGQTAPHEIGGELTFFKTLKAKDDTETAGTAKPENPGPPSEKLLKAEERAEIDAGGNGSSVVQVSAFRDIWKAHEMVDDLKNRGFRAFTKSSPAERGERWYRVYVGPFVSKEDASGALKDLSDKGFGGGFLTDLESGTKTR